MVRTGNVSAAHPCRVMRSRALACAATSRYYPPMRTIVSRAISVLFACMGLWCVGRCVHLGMYAVSSAEMIIKAAISIVGSFALAYGAWGGRTWAARGALFVAAMPISSVAAAFVLYGETNPKLLVIAGLGVALATVSTFSIAPEQRKTWPTAVSAIAGVFAPALIFSLTNTLLDLAPHPPRAAPRDPQQHRPRHRPRTSTRSPLIGCADNPPR